MLNPGDIIVITVMEENPKTHRQEVVVSHGIDHSTGKTVILSGDRPSEIGAVFEKDLGEWVLRAKPEDEKLSMSHTKSSSTLLTPSAPQRAPAATSAPEPEPESEPASPARKGFRNLGKR